MLPEVVQVRRLHHPRGHIAVLDALIGENGRGQAAVQVHVPQPLHIQPGDGVIAFPDRLQFRRGQLLEGGFQLPGLFQKYWQAVHGKAVRILRHFFRWRDDNTHRSCLSFFDPQ